MSWKKQLMQLLLWFIVEANVSSWLSVATSHSSLLDWSLPGILFLTNEIWSHVLWHSRAISSLCMLYNIGNNSGKFFYRLLPDTIQQMYRNFSRVTAITPAARPQIVLYSAKNIHCWDYWWNGWRRSIFFSNQSGGTLPRRFRLAIAPTNSEING